MTYVVCAKCGKKDKPIKAVIKNGVIVTQHNTGTAITMRCSDCAKYCRDCCPTGHGTRR